MRVLSTCTSAGISSRDSSGTGLQGSSTGEISSSFGGGGSGKTPLCGVYSILNFIFPLTVFDMYVHRLSHHWLGECRVVFCPSFTVFLWLVLLLSPVPAMMWKWVIMCL